MEPFIADFIRDSEIPKGIRFGIASLLCGLIIAVCLLVSFKSPFIGAEFSAVCQQSHL